jgi:hypothetical protein
VENVIFIELYVKKSFGEEVEMEKHKKGTRKKAIVRE